MADWLRRKDLYDLSTLLLASSALLFVGTALVLVVSGAATPADGSDPGVFEAVFNAVRGLFS